MSNDQDSPAGPSGRSPNAAIRALQAVLPDVIRRRFALKFALVLLIMGLILVGLGFAATQALSGQVESDARAEYERLANQQASLVGTWIEGNIVSIKLASQNDALHTDLSTDEARQDLNRDLRDPFSRLYGSTAAYVVTESDTGEPTIVGHQSWGANREPEPVSETGREWLAEENLGGMSQAEVRMSNVYVTDGSDDPVVGFVTRIDGLPRFLVLEFRVSDLAQSVGAHENESNRQFSMLVDANGTVQSDTRMNRDGGQSAVLESYPNSETVAIATDESSSGGVRIVENDPSVMDEPYAVGYADIETGEIDPQWAIVTHAPTGELFGFVRQITRLGQLVTIIGAIAIGLVGATMGYSTAGAIDRLRRRVEEMERGNLEVTIETTRIDSIGQLYDGFARMRDALKSQIEEAQQARKEAEVARAEAMEMNEYLQGKAEEYSDIMGQCATGDLTVRMDVDGENDSMDQIATDFNAMIDELEKTTGQIKNFADEVDQSGEIVETSAENVRDAAEQVADSIQTISEDATDQQDRLEAIAAEIENALDRLGAATDDTPDAAIEDLRSVAEAIDELAERTETTMAESETVAGAAEEQAAELTAVSQQANDLTRYARPLRDVLESFETDEAHEFYVPTGPRTEEEDDE